jgi:hypothetical protein
MQLAFAKNYKVLVGGYGIFQPGRVNIRPERLLRVHGYKNPAAVRPAIREAAAAMARRAEDLIAAEVHYRRRAVRALDDGALILEDGIRFECPAFPRYLADAREVVVAVATMGAALDQDVIARLADGRFEPLEALFLETAGWLGVEQTAKQFGDYLRTLVRPNGYAISCRLGPGYSYRIDGREIPWPLEEQKKIFAAFDGIDLPVRLLESCAMLPKMSRSGLYGLAPVH